MDSKYRLLVSIAFLAALAFLLSKLDIRAVYDQLLLARKRYLLVAAGLFGIMLYFKIQKLVWISRYFAHPISFAQGALVQMVGISIAMMTPGRVGEGSKVLLLRRHTNAPVPTSFNVVILERITDIALLSAGAFFLSFYILQDMAAITGAFFLLFVVALFIFLRRPGIILGLVPAKYREYLAIERKSNKPLFFIIIGATFCIWGFEAVFQWLLLRAFDTHISIFLVFGVFCISTIMVFFSVLPAGLGSVDASYLILYPLVGVPIEVAASVLLLYRFLSTPVPFVASAVVLNYYHLSIGDIRKEIKGK
jgi:uncharacterized membrane protein YbhN (UPF0104 family)